MSELQEIGKVTSPKKFSVLWKIESPADLPVKFRTRIWSPLFIPFKRALRKGALRKGSLPKLACLNISLKFISRKAKLDNFNIGVVRENEIKQHKESSWLRASWNPELKCFIAYTTTLSQNESYRLFCEKKGCCAADASFLKEIERVKSVAQSIKNPKENTCSGLNENDIYFIRDELDSDDDSDVDDDDYDDGNDPLYCKRVVFRHCGTNENESKKRILAEELKVCNAVLAEMNQRKDAHCRDFKSLDKLSADLKDMYSESQDFDLTLKVKGKEFKAHKFILKARTPVFKAMLSHDLSESKDGIITIEDCEPEVFSQFLLFLYTGKVQNLSSNNVYALYYTADKYDSPELMEKCIEFLKDTLSPEIICDVFSLATNHCESGLFHVAVQFFFENVKEILVTANWQLYLKENPTLANELHLKAVKLGFSKT